MKNIILCNLIGADVQFEVMITDLIFWISTQVLKTVPINYINFASIPSSSMYNRWTLCGYTLLLENPHFCLNFKYT